MDLVESVLTAAAEKQAKYKTTEVEKLVDLEIDEGNLLAIDTNPIDVKLFRSKREAYLQQLARDNTQLLFNQIWELPVERVEDAIVAKLPDPKTILPREKPVPKAKKLTKWEEYAKLKGINKKKRGRMIWDDRSQEWKPRWGYKRANDDTKDWAIEVPDNADPFEDQFAKRLKAKKERVAKNELQRLRNIARRSKSKVPGVGLTPTDAPDKDDISRQLHAARTSDASIGKFSRTLPKEKPQKNQGKKRKFQPNIGDFSSEKKRSLDILNKVNSGRPILDVSRAKNKVLAEEDGDRKSAKAGRKGGKKGGKGGKKDTGFGGGKKGGKKGGKTAGKRKGGKR